MQACMRARCDREHNNNAPSRRMVYFYVEAAAAAASIPQLCSGTHTHTHTRTVMCGIDCRSEWEYAHDVTMLINNIYNIYAFV